MYKITLQNGHHYVVNDDQLKELEEDNVKITSQKEIGSKIGFFTTISVDNLIDVKLERDQSTKGSCYFPTYKQAADFAQQLA